MDIEQAGKATEGPNQSQQKLAKLIYKNSAPNGSKIVYIYPCKYQSSHLN